MTTIAIVIGFIYTLVGVLIFSMGSDGTEHFLTILSIILLWPVIMLLVMFDLVEKHKNGGGKNGK